MTALELASIACVSDRDWERKNDLWLLDRKDIEADAFAPALNTTTFLSVSPVPISGRPNFVAASSTIAMRKSLVTVPAITPTM